MSHSSAIGVTQHSIDFARARDAKIVWLLGMHPVTAMMLVRLGLFPSRNKALKRLNRLVGKKRIRLVGTVCRKTGRPENVYCRCCPNQDNTPPQAQLTTPSSPLNMAKSGGTSEEEERPSRGRE